MQGAVKFKVQLNSHCKRKTMLEWLQRSRSSLVETPLVKRSSTICLAVSVSSICDPRSIGSRQFVTQPVNVRSPGLHPKLPHSPPSTASLRLVDPPAGPPPLPRTASVDSVLCNFSLSWFNSSEFVLTWFLKFSQGSCHHLEFLLHPGHMILFVSS